MRASVANESRQKHAPRAESQSCWEPLSPPQWSLDGASSSKPDTIRIALIVISKEILHLRQCCCQNWGTAACSAVCLLLSRTTSAPCQAAALQGYGNFDLSGPTSPVQGIVGPRIPTSTAAESRPAFFPNNSNHIGTNLPPTQGPLEPTSSSGCKISH